MSKCCFFLARDYILNRRREPDERMLPSSFKISATFFASSKLKVNAQNFLGEIVSPLCALIMTARYRSLVGIDG